MVQVRAMVQVWAMVQVRAMARCMQEAGDAVKEAVGPRAFRGRSAAHAVGDGARLEDLT